MFGSVGSFVLLNVLYNIMLLNNLSQGDITIIVTEATEATLEKLVSFVKVVKVAPLMTEATGVIVGTGATLVIVVTVVSLVSVVKVVSVPSELKLVMVMTLVTGATVWGQRVSAYFSCNVTVF